MKNVQISYELFVKLLLYHLAEDYDDTEEIAKGLQDKLDSMIRHQHYTEYKTAETEEEKQAARQKYLDEVKRFENPHTYYVDLSQKLWDIRYDLLKAYNA